MAKQKALSHAQHIRRSHKHRVGWFVAMAIGLITIQAIAHFNQPIKHVLAYAVNVNHADLTAVTNQKRAQNGLGPLTLNSKLNSGAQAKSQHMVTHNYWAHTAPDGTEPWYFFDWSGYNYVHAGENLAYGFADSAEIVDAWMGSAGHRANILGDYKDIGFGFTNGSSYQGGQNTVVVAFYGTQPAPPPPPPAPKPTPAPTPAPQPAPAPPPVVEPTPEPVPSVEEPTTDPDPEPIAVQPETPATEAEVVVAAPQRVTNLQNLLSGNASWVVYASLAVVGVAIIGFAATHRELVRKGWKASAHFILIHPLLDAIVLIAIVIIVLLSSAGFVR